MVRDPLQQSLQRQRSGFGMYARPLKIFHIGLTQNSSHLFANADDEFQFFQHAAMSILQARSKDVGISTEQRWIVLDKNAFHSIRIDRFEVCQVTDDLLDGPLSGDRLQFILLGLYLS